MPGPDRRSSLRSASKVEMLECNILVVGAIGVGKTALVSQFANGCFPSVLNPTIGAEFQKRQISFPAPEASNKEIQATVLFMDSAGSEQAQDPTQASMQGAMATHLSFDVVLIVYDVTNQASFEQAKMLVEQHAKTDDVVIALVGNKIDERDKRVVQDAQLREFVRGTDVKVDVFGVVSAKMKDTTDNIFEAIVKQAYPVFSAKRAAECVQAAEGTLVSKRDKRAFRALEKSHLKAHRAVMSVPEVTVPQIADVYREEGGNLFRALYWRCFCTREEVKGSLESRADKRPNGASKKTLARLPGEFFQLKIQGKTKHKKDERKNPSLAV